MDRRSSLSERIGGGSRPRFRMKRGLLRREDADDLAHRAGGLAAAYALVLAVLVVRIRVRARHGDRYANRSGSPAPTRVTSG